MTQFKANYEDMLPSNYFYKQSEVIDKFGPKYRLEIQNSLIIKDSALFESFLKDSLIQFEDKQISEKLLLDLVNNPGMFGYLMENLKRTINNYDDVVVKIIFIDDEGYIDSNRIIIKRYEILKMLQMIDETKIKTSTFKAWIKTCVNEDSLKIALKNKTEIFYIDGVSTEENLLDLFNILFMPENEFNNFIKNNPRSKELIFMLINYIETNQILKKYELSKESYERYQLLKQNKIIDIESINLDRKLIDPDNYDNVILSSIEVNPEVLSFVNEGMLDTYSKTEKALHIYIKLCYLILNNPNIVYTQKGIDKQDNIYSFPYLYAALLGNEGILKKIIRPDQVNEVGNDSVKVISDEFIISADAYVKDNTDLLSALDSIRCINSNENTKKIFMEKIYKVYTNIIENYNKQIRFNEAKEKYEPKKEISDVEELYLILEAITASALKGPELISYEKEMLSKLTNKSLMTYSFMCDYKSNKYFEYEVISIISLNINDDYEYFILNTNDHTIKSVSKGYLYESIVSGDYKYLNANEQAVPGLGLESVVKYAR